MRNCPFDVVRFVVLMMSELCGRCVLRKHHLCDIRTYVPWSKYVVGSHIHRYSTYVHLHSLS